MTKRDRKAEAEPHRPSFWQASLALSTVSLIGFVTNPVCAQITPDNSLGSESSIVTPDVTVKNAVADFIEGGAIRGNNLFHSFADFNVSEGGRVYFSNPDGIANILTRVTGDNLSEIFGTLGVDGAANLFLLNPNGIVFGENAALDLNGSFLVTTGDSYIFDNGFAYSASNPEVPSLLTINLPVGLQFGKSVGTVEVTGDGLNYTENFPTNNFGLTVASGKTLTLLGGDVKFTGAIASNFGGRLDVGSVANGEVGLEPSVLGWNLKYDRVNNFGNINLSDRATIWSPISSPSPDAGIYLLVIYQFKLIALKY
jgi:filamentous hemagglutinin family protein